MLMHRLHIQNANNLQKYESQAGVAFCQVFQHKTASKS